MPSHGDPLRVAIIGGGMGGLFCALSIFHHCKDKVKIEVYEQAAQYLEIGAGVGLGINGARLIHHLGLGDELNAIAGFRQGVWISFRRYDNGEEIVSVPSNDTGKVRQAPVARSDALDLFRMAVEQRGAATLHTKKRFQRVEDNGEDVTIHFADGTTAMADLVIGSDGIHSGVRNQFIDDKSVYSGQVAYRATIPTSELKDWPLQSYSAMWCAKHKHFLTFPIAQNKTLNVVAFLNAHGRDAEKVAESWTSVCDRKDVEEDFKDFEPIVQRIISLMPEKPSKWRINDREPLNKWHYMGGKVMLLGDAAHAMLPHMGAGAGQAIEDGWVLARTLADFLGGSGTDTFADLEACAAFYQDVRLPRAQQVQRSSRQAGATYDMQTEEMSHKSFEECLHVIKETTEKRQKIVWEVEVDVAYDNAKKAKRQALFQ